MEKKDLIKKFLDSDSGYATATKVVLAVLVAGAIVCVGVAAPNIFQIFKKSKRYKRYSDVQIKNAVYGLKRGGLIKIIEYKNGERKIILTDKGRIRMDKLMLDELRIEKPKKWDNKWRVVLFDIPVKYGKARGAFRFKIKQMGFYQLQKSVWVYPHHCYDEILFTAKMFKVDNFVEILTVEHLLNDKKLKTFFNL